MSTLQINKTKYKQFKLAAIGSGVVLALGGLAFFQPFSLTDNSYAETATGTASAEMSVNLDPTITIWTTDTNNNNIDSINIAADPDESVYTGAGRVHVSTNNLTGYTLTIQSNSTDAKMKHENTSVTKTIDPLTSSGTSASSWAGNSSLNNMWGYSIGTNDSYVGVPGSSSTTTTIDSTDAPNNDNYTDVTFATKADLSLPAGTYTDTVIFSAVANSEPNTWMQDFTVTECNALAKWSYDSTTGITTPGDTKVLWDKRDGNSYKVRRLADGNCWMVQNLRLINATIDAANSDMASGNFTIPASSTDWGTDVTQYNAKAYDSGSTEYGIYYNWYTATASSGKTILATDANNASASICPKNWRLPTASSSNEWDDVIMATFGDYFVDIPSGDAANFLITSALSLPIQGIFYNNSIESGSQGYFSEWWTSTKDELNGGPHGSFYTFYAEAPEYFVLLSGGAGSSSVSYGHFVRCLLSSE